MTRCTPFMLCRADRNLTAVCRIAVRLPSSESCCSRPPTVPLPARGPVIRPRETGVPKTGVISRDTTGKTMPVVRYST